MKGFLEVPEGFCRSTATGPLGAGPVSSIPACNVGKMGGKVKRRVRVQSGVLRDIAVSRFPVSVSGSGDCLTEVDSFVYPVGGGVEGGSNCVVVDSGEGEPGWRGDGGVWGVVGVNAVAGYLGVEYDLEEHGTSGLVSGLAPRSGDTFKGGQGGPRGSLTGV